MQETQVQSLGWEDPLQRKWQPTPVGKPMDRGVWWAEIHAVTKCQTQLSINTQESTDYY